LFSIYCIFDWCSW